MVINRVTYVNTPSFTLHRLLRGLSVLYSIYVWACNCSRIIQTDTLALLMSTAPEKKGSCSLLGGWKRSLSRQLEQYIARSVVQSVARSVARSGKGRDGGGASRRDEIYALPVQYNLGAGPEVGGLRLLGLGWPAPGVYDQARGRRQGAGKMKCTLYLPGYSRLVQYTIGACPGGGGWRWAEVSVVAAIDALDSGDG